LVEPGRGGSPGFGVVMPSALACGGYRLLPGPGSLPRRKPRRALDQVRKGRFPFRNWPKTWCVKLRDARLCNPKVSHSPRVIDDLYATCRENIGEVENFQHSPVQSVTSMEQDLALLCSARVSRRRRVNNGVHDRLGRSIVLPESRNSIQAGILVSTPLPYGVQPPTVTKTEMLACRIDFSYLLRSLMIAQV
jgi:hypothetical protein